MKLYKNTLIISIVVFAVCVLLSLVFEFTCLSKFNIISFLSDYIIGIACSIVVVIITTFLQLKYEQRKILHSILSDVQFLFFDYLLIVLSLDPAEKTPDKIWQHYYDKVYNGTRKISSQLSDIEWFSKKKTKTVNNLQKAILQIMINLSKRSDKKEYGLLYIDDISSLNEIKDNALELAKSSEYLTKEITHNYEELQLELEELKH